MPVRLVSGIAVTYQSRGEPARGYWQPLPELARANGHVHPLANKQVVYSSAIELSD